MTENDTAPIATPRLFKARVADIARQAGVSTATVDRVLNQRPGVHARTVQQVLQAAAALDHAIDKDLVAAVAGKPMRLTFVLPSGSNRWVNELGRDIAASAAHWSPFNVSCRVERAENFNPQALADALLRHGARADGVAFMALEHPLVREAVHTLNAASVPVMTLLSDISNSPRIAYAGVDNRAAGRTAGYLLGRFLRATEGRLAMIAGSRSYRAYEEREMGFLHIAEELLPRMQVVGLREGHDHPERNYLQTRELLAQYPDLVGIYNIGAASDGVARALQEAGCAQRVVFIGHGLTPDTRALLVDGTLDAVIHQSPEAVMMACVRTMTNWRDHRDLATGVERVQNAVFLRENLP